MMQRGIDVAASTGGAVRLRLYSAGHEPEDVLTFWRRRVASQDPALSLTWSPEWFAMMAVGWPRGAYVAEVRVGSGQLRAVLPFHVRDWDLRVTLARRNLLRVRVPTAKICGGDLLEKDLSADQLARVWGLFREAMPSVRAFWFDHVPKGGRLDLLRRSCGERTVLHPLGAEIPHYRRRLRGLHGDVTGLRSQRSLNRLRSKEHGLVRDVGPIRLVEVRGPEDWQPYARSVESMMNRAWQARLLGHGFRFTDHTRVAERGWLRGFVLLAGARPAAFVLCYEGHGTLVYEQLGYDQDLARYSPGTLLLYRVLDRLTDEGKLDYLDFGEGEAEYKKALANERILVCNVLVAHKSLGLLAGLRAVRASDAIDQTLRRLVQRLGLRARLRRALQGDS